VARHKVQVWLLNTGWTGGPYGVGRRIGIDHTRGMLRAALAGELDGVGMREDPVFGLRIPRVCPGVPPEVLDPRSTWKDRPAYDEMARNLAGMFDANFAEYAAQVEPKVRAAGVRRQA
jgi:phosphoenolpyruvate carboxykinase (ATP)